MSEIRVQEIVPGCKTVDTGDTRIVFGVPSDIIKFFAIKKQSPGNVAVLPDRLYDRGTIQSVEFPLYRYIFGSGANGGEKKFTIIGTPRVIAQIREILHQTVIGPRDEELEQWSRCGEAEMVRKIRIFFRKDFQSIDEIVNLISFDRNDCARLGDVTIYRRGGNTFEVSYGEDHCVLNITTSEHAITPPSEYSAPGELIRPMRLGAVVLGTSSGFDPRGDTSNIIIFAKHLGISIDGSPWMSERLNLFGIPPKDVKLFIITHLHDDHSNIFQMIIKGYRSTIATTNLIYRSFLVKASNILSIPVEDVEKLIYFVELKPGQAVKWYSNKIECFYTAHPIPTIGIIINDRIMYSGDTLWGSKLKAIADEGNLSPEYCSLLQNLPLRPKIDLIFMDGGGGAIHPDPAELAALPASVRKKMYITHVSSISPEMEEKVHIGKPGQIFHLDDHRVKLDFEDVLALSESTLMRGSPQEWLRVFCAVGKVILEGAHRVIVDERTPPDYFYFLLRGTLKVMKGEDVVTRIYSGDYFGEMIFLGAKKRTATIVAESAVKILAIPQDIFQDFVSDENVKKNLVKIMNLRPNFFQTSIFGDTPENYLEDIILRCKHREYRAGEDIVTEGDIGDDMYLILKGTCEVTKRMKDQKMVIRTIGRYDIFGEMALLSESKIRQATVTALEPVEVALFSKEFLHNLTESIPSIFYNLTVIMDERREQDLIRIEPV
jgi:CRP-like cAMP-binding protein